MAIGSVSLHFGERYALDEPPTDRPPSPFGLRLIGPVIRPRISRGVFLVVLARNRTILRPIVRCRHRRIVRRVVASAMQFAGGSSIHGENI